MAAELWTPSNEDMYCGREAYVQYIGGVMLLHDPEHPVSQGLIGRNEITTPDTAEAVVVQAEQIMYRGLYDMILHANPPRVQIADEKIDHRYDKALPFIREMVASACDMYGDRLDRINPAITCMQPMPLNSRSMYATIAHNRRGNILTRKLMGPFMPAPEFASLLDGRKLHGHTARRDLFDAN